MAIGIGFALIMGAIGGVFPARMAAKKEILCALRDLMDVNGSRTQKLAHRPQQETTANPRRWATGWILTGIALILLWPAADSIVTACEPCH